MRDLLTALLMLLISTTIGWGKIAVVPDQFVSIHSGIDAVDHGDTVLVKNGRYIENINFLGKRIVVASLFIVDGDPSHIVNTIIDGSQPALQDSGSVVYFVSGEDTNSVLVGFTITGGSGTFSHKFGSAWVGGGVMIGHGATLRDNIIRENSLVYSGNVIGGGIFAGYFEDGFVIIENNTVDRNTARGDYSWGGGIWIGINGRITKNRIANNKAIASQGWCVGAGIACHSPSENFRFTVTVSNNRIHENTGTAMSNTIGSYGGGLDLYYSNARLQDNWIYENILNSGYACFGPAIRLVFTQSVSISGNNVSLNQALGNSLSNAGGVLLYETVQTIVSKNLFFGNSGVWGGAILDFNSTGTIIDHNEFHFNVATNDGGAILTTSDALIHNNIFQENAALQNGGAIFFDNSPTRMYNNIVIQNVANYGGAIAIDGSLSRNYHSRFGDIANELFAGGHRTEPQTQMRTDLPVHKRMPDIINNVIVGNHALAAGGAMSLEDADPVIMNTIFWDNTAPTDSLLHSLNSSAEITFSITQQPVAGVGNFVSEPQFADKSYILRPVSPAVDAGNPDMLYADPSALNSTIACAPALGSIRNDIGAYGGPYVGVDSLCLITSIGENQNMPLVETFVLYQNYPNPFNPATEIRYRLNKTADVNLSIFNNLGQKVRTLVSQQQSAGEWSVQWNGTDDIGVSVSAGVYYYRLKTAGQALTRKMLLLK